MADVIRRNQTLFIKAESTEGTLAACAAGDAVLAEKIAVKLQQEFHQRQYQGAYGYRDGVPGAQTGAGVSFSAEIKGDGSTNTCELDAALTACFGSVATGTGSSTLTGADSTTTTLHVVSSTNFTVGNGVLVETGSGTGIYEAAWISTITDATHIVVEPALSAAVNLANGSNVKEMRTYQILLPPSAVNSVSIESWYNSDVGAGQCDKFAGCRGNVKFSSPRAGEIPKLDFDFMAWNWTQVTNGTRPTPTYDTATPKAGLASKLKLGGTLTDAWDTAWDLGAKIQPKLSQNSTLGVYGTPTVDYTPSGSLKLHEVHSSIAHYTAWQAGTTTTLSQQFGTGLFGTVAWYAPRAQRREVARGDDGGVGATEIQFDLLTQNDGTPTSITAGPGALYLSVG